MSSATSDKKNYIALANFLIQIKDPCNREKNIEELLKSGFDVNYAVPRYSPQSEFFGYTALHFAVERECREGCSSIVKLLLSHGADVLRKNDKGFTPLRLAYELCRDFKQDFEQSMGNRAWKNLIGTLLTAHCELKNAINPCCKDGISHFHIACATGELLVVVFFLEKGIPIDLPIKRGTYAGCTSLHLAVLNKKVKMVELLLKQGADCTCLNARGMTPVHLVIENQLKDYFYNITERSCDLKTRRNEEIIKQVLKKSFKNVESFDCIGLTSLHVYSTGQFESELLKECDILLKAGANVNARINFDSPIWPGYTPLHFAGSLGMFHFLLKNGANPCAQDANGVTPLDLYLEAYGPGDVVPILETHSLLKSIQFQNNLKLSKVLGDVSSFGYTDPNTAIPLESPLWPGATLLHVAVKLSQDDAARVKLFLRKGANLTIQDANGMTALHLAFHLRKIYCIYEILKAHVNTLSNPVDSSGLSHFHISCIAGNRKIVEMFLTAGDFDPNVALKTDAKPHYPVLQEKSGRVEYPEINTGSTPLHIAATTRNPWLAELLLQNGADPDRRDADGMTWMHRIFGYKSISRFIKTLSMPQTIKSNSVVVGGLSHLHVACCAGSEYAIEELLPLLGKAEDINRPIGKEVIGILGELPDDMCFGDTPLHLASRTHSARIVDLLLKNGADVEAKNADGLSPLHVALVEGTNFLIERLTLEYYKRKMWPDEIGLTKLHIACALKDVPMIEGMLKYGENANSQIKRDSPLWPGDTPIHVLIRKGYPTDGDAIKLLLKHILEDVNKTAVNNRPLHESAKQQKLSSSNSFKLPANSEGLSALHISCMLEDSDIVEEFLELGVDFDTPKDYLASEDPGYFPLHFAVKYGSEDIVELLLKHKVNVDSQDAYGDTPLHLDAWIFDEELILFLRAKQFNLMKKNIHGQSAMEFILSRIKCPDKFDITLELLKNGLTTYLDFSNKAKVLETLGSKFNGRKLQLLIRSFPNLSDVDEDGRNIFYHVDFSKSLSSSKFVNLFVKIAEELEYNGCDLDHRDKKGRTALHYAAISGNVKKVKALLFVGADINITDFDKKTPFSICFSESKLTSFLLNIKNIFYNHIHKLKLAKLHVCYFNEFMYERVNFPIQWQGSLPLSTMKEQMITESFSLHDVLMEDMAMRFPIMPEYQRRAIVKYVDSADLQKYYPDWMPLFKMQRRKALQIERLYEIASDSLRGLLDPRLPEHCLDSILIQLSTKDWQNVISAKDGK